MHLVVCIDHEVVFILKVLWINFVGPFVMNTAEQIRETLEDYSRGKNGFERAPGWESEIGKARMF